jgi:protein-tyrosine phosphatase
LDFVTDNIVIGDGVEAEDEDLLLETGITHVLNVHPMKMEYEKIYTKEKYAKIPWHDEENLERLDEALDYMDQALKSGGKVLVICGAGFERSPLTVFAYLNRKQGLSIEDTLRLVLTKRPQSDLHLGWLGDWLEYTEEESLRFRRYF